MGLEDLTGGSKYISDLVNTNPVGASDPKSAGDDHIRGIKNTLLNTFPSVTGAITATHTELNLMDGVTSTTAELNILDGVTSTAAELNILDGVTSTAAELNILDGVTSTAAELNILDGVTSTATELNLLDGRTAADFVPSGVILMWSGAISAIPSGWLICDGTSGTPDLTAQFVIHADADSGGTYDVGDTGGANTHVLTEAELPAHDHAGAAATYTYDYGSSGAGLAGGSAAAPRSTSLASVGSGDAHNNMPAYYALAYIMKA